MIDVEESTAVMTEFENDAYLPRFILIDDDPVTNVISEMVIKIALGNVPVKVFTNGNAGLEFIKTYLPSESHKPTIILLDLNMPIISGWEFLEYFNNLSEDFKSTFRIFILSSSINERDKERSHANKHVIDYIPKPLTKEIALLIDRKS